MEFIGALELPFPVHWCDQQSPSLSRPVRAAAAGSRPPGAVALSVQQPGTQMPVTNRLQHMSFGSRPPPPTQFPHQLIFLRRRQMRHGLRVLPH